MSGATNVPVEPNRSASNNTCGEGLSNIRVNQDHHVDKVNKRAQALGMMAVGQVDNSRGTLTVSNVHMGQACAHRPHAWPVLVYHTSITHGITHGLTPTCSVTGVTDTDTENP